MKKVVWSLILLVSTVFFAGCNTDGGQLINQALHSNVSVVQEGEETPTPAVKAPTKVMLISPYGRVLADKAGKPLYLKADDINGISSCYGECAVAWPPLLVESSEGIFGEYGTVARDDETLQLTYLGQPVYTYASDRVGKVTGDGTAEIWSVIVLPE